MPKCLRSGQKSFILDHYHSDKLSSATTLYAEDLQMWENLMHSANHKIILHFFKTYAPNKEDLAKKSDKQIKDFL